MLATVACAVAHHPTRLQIPAPEPAWYDSGRSAVVGLTLDARDSTPVEGAVVRLRSLPQGELTQHGTYSTAAGAFRLARLPPGKYLVEMLRLGYSRDSLALDLDAGQVDTVVFLLRLCCRVDYDHLLQVAREHAADAGLSDLRASSWPSDDVELRIWSGSGILGEQGLVLRRHGGRWEALRVRGVNRDGPFTISQVALPSRPAELWSQLLAAGLLELPPFPERDVPKMVMDGGAFVVEVREGKGYRASVFDNPADFGTPADQRMLRIAQLLAAAFPVE